MTVRTGLNDRSGAITAGGTAQTVEAPNAGRSYILIQNVSVGDLWVDFGETAVVDAPSIKVAADASLVFDSGFVPSGAISVIGATTGQKFTAKIG